MKIHNIEIVKTAYEKKDLAALKRLAKPSNRVINKSDEFRSVLMLSCHNLQHLMKIESVAADCIILNLEDGVSKEQKPFALVLCAFFLSHHRKCNKKLVVRVNALEEGGYEEIAYLNGFMPDAVRVPKIKTKKEVQSALKSLDAKIDLHLSIETSESWNALASLRVDTRVKVFYLGILDLFADMKLPQSLIKRDNPTVLYMLSHFLVTCKAADVKPVSFVYQEFQNTEEFKEWISLEKKMGYTAKGCLSPTQAKLVNQIFSTQEQEISRAKDIVKIFENKREEGVTGFEHKEYGFIDEPVYKGALALLRRDS